jgi:hypothetical protein
MDAIGQQFLCCFVFVKKSGFDLWVRWRREFVLPPRSADRDNLCKEKKPATFFQFVLNSFFCEKWRRGQAAPRHGTDDGNAIGDKGQFINVKKYIFFLTATRGSAAA